MEDKWIEKPSPKSLRQGTAWFGQMNHCYVYGTKYAVLTRDVETAWGKVIHCAIRNGTNTDIPWKEKQWIKNSLFGEERTAIEVFPKESRLIDAANMYHLWILEKDYELPFGIHADDLSERKER